MAKEEEITLVRLNQNDPSLTCLTIEPIDTEEDSADSKNRIRLFQSALEGNSFLEELSISNLPLPTEFIPILCSLQNLTILRLENVGLTLHCVAKLADGMAKQSKLRILSLADNPKLGPRGCKGLTSLLSNMAKLQELNLGNIGMGHYGAQGLNIPDQLERLTLSRNQLGIDGIWKLSLPTKTLLELDISHNGCLDDGCMELTKILPIHLSSLDLSFNSIGTPGLEALAKALQKHQYLQRLNISNNRIEQVPALAQLLSMRNEASSELDRSWEPLSKSSLQVLDVSHNDIHSSACLMLAEALRNNTCLRELNLSHNNIDDEGAGGFVDILDDNTELHFLDLSGNEEISDARLRILDMLLKHRIQRLDSVIAEEPVSSHTTQPAVLEEVNPHITNDPDNSILQKGKRCLLGCVKSKTLDCSESEKISLQAYLTSATNGFDLRSLVSHGAFGALHRLNDPSLPEHMLVRCQRLHGEQKRSETVFHDIVMLHKEHSSSHDSIASLVTCLVSNDMLVFVYHIPDATSLADTLRNNPSSLKWPDRIEIVRKIASVLDSLHSCDYGRKSGNFHGDLNPKNIYLTKGGRLHVQVLDCFFNRLPTVDAARWLAGDVVYGSRGYRCPRYERGSCRYDSASDIFSLGIVVAELMTGKLQASKNTGATAWDVYYECVLARQPLVADPAINAPTAKSILSVLGKVVGMCLNPRVQDRPSALFILQLLNQLEQDAP